MAKKKAGDSDFDSMDVIFDPPQEITDPALREMYEVLIFNARKEIRNLPLLTMQLMLVERIANMYISLKHKEQNGRSNYIGSSYHKSLNTIWLNMMKELNSTLNINGDFQRKQILGDVRDIIVDTLSDVDPEVRDALLTKFAEKFQEAGL